ncbi:MAG TPA: phosphoribosylformylglycinamidine cyclo-ligase [Caldithrix abyssi]|uniref:Phosphoribosylformylglycinamidine cyclo-ligase n=1 Tax=Caldithrix abyssi TaxID=187145 RepID=A0A7V1PUZ8_CALAY|nr:phosphoribosylformylglycinamidine cyclo-ligase [Caldithrix abyssi]
MKQHTYAASGVDIARGEKAVSDVKSMIHSTFTSGVLSGVGGFGGLFELPAGYKKPVLVSSTDGVGTKLRVALMAGRHDTVGEDLVNHCVNDIAVTGARPLFFLDYYGTGNLDPEVFGAVIRGFVRGCRNNGCALIGGETAEMPGIYHDKDYDLAGTIVGIVEKDDIVDTAGITSGDILLGLPSNGLHTNGYSLARAVLFEAYAIEQHVPELGMTLADELLKVHRSYLEEITATRSLARGYAHITGGGIEGNTARLLSAGLKLKIDWQAWRRPPVFDLIQKNGNVPEEDMRRSFNLGIGLVMIVAPEKAAALKSLLQKRGEQVIELGEVAG